jgi:acyl dehydratase
MLYSRQSPAIGRTPDLQRSEALSLEQARSIGATVTVSKTLSEADIALFLLVTNETTPFGDEPPLTSRHTREAAPLSMLAALLASAAVGHALRPSSARFLSQSVRYCEPAYTDDTVVATAQVTARDEAAHALQISVSCENQEGRRLAEGEILLAED